MKMWKCENNEIIHKALSIDSCKKDNFTLKWITKDMLRGYNLQKGPKTLDGVIIHVVLRSLSSSF